jgi:hypothetical protein
MRRACGPPYLRSGRDPELFRPKAHKAYLRHCRLDRLGAAGAGQRRRLGDEGEEDAASINGYIDEYE